jgi:hypothetical protein
LRLNSGGGVHGGDHRRRHHHHHQIKHILYCLYLAHFSLENLAEKQLHVMSFITDTNTE